MPYRSIAASCVLCSLLASQAAAGEKKQGKTPKPTVRKSKKYGMHFYYAGKASVEEYFKANSCLAGYWQFNKESKTHWIGELHHAAENSPSRVTGVAKGRPLVAFMFDRIAVRKQPGMPINMKTFRETLILRKRDQTVSFDLLNEPEKITYFDLVGYAPKGARRPRRSFFYDHHHLMYKPPKAASKQKK